MQREVHAALIKAHQRDARALRDPRGGLSVNPRNEVQFADTAVGAVTATCGAPAVRASASASRARGPGRRRRRPLRPTELSSRRGSRRRTRPRRRAALSRPAAAVAVARAGGARTGGLNAGAGAGCRARALQDQARRREAVWAPSQPKNTPRALSVNLPRRENPLIRWPADELFLTRDLAGFVLPPAQSKAMAEHLLARCAPPGAFALSARPRSRA